MKGRDKRRKAAKRKLRTQPGCDGQTIEPVKEMPDAKRIVVTATQTDAVSFSRR